MRRRHVGLWRTSVLEIEVERPERRRYTRRATEAADGLSMRVLLGDESGARSQLTMPFNRRCGLSCVIRWQLGLQDLRWHVIFQRESRYCRVTKPCVDVVQVRAGAGGGASRTARNLK